MYMKSIGWLASLGLIAFIAFGWIDSDGPHIPATLVKSNSSAVGIEKPSTNESHQAAMPALKADEPKVSRTLSLDKVSVHPSASSAAVPPVPEVGSLAYEQMSKRDLYGQKVVVETPIAVNPPPAKESPEFAAIMAVKNAEMNALYGRQAAQSRLQPEAPPVQEPSNRKAPI
jgi:hypothetical protein